MRMFKKILVVLLAAATMVLAPLTAFAEDFNPFNYPPNPPANLCLLDEHDNNVIQKNVVA